MFFFALVSIHAALFSFANSCASVGSICRLEIKVAIATLQAHESGDILLLQVRFRPDDHTWNVLDPTEVEYAVIQDFDHIK